MKGTVEDSADHYVRYLSTNRAVADDITNAQRHLAWTSWITRLYPIRMDFYNKSDLISTNHVLLEKNWCHLIVGKICLIYIYNNPYFGYRILCYIQMSSTGNVLIVTKQWKYAFTDKNYIEKLCLFDSAAQIIYM